MQRPGNPIKPHAAEFKVIWLRLRDSELMDCAQYKSHYAEFSKLPLPREVCDSLEWSDWMEHFHECESCFDWTLGQRITSRGFDPGDFPCVHIGTQVTTNCPDHPDPADCPDILISYFARFDEYSIAVRDGDTSAIGIRFCPWCSVAPPDSKRNRWFDELTALGYTDFHGDDIPPEFWTDAWYKNAK
jgi:hypothetical protein